MKKILITIAVIAIIGTVGYAVAAPGKPGLYDEFAQCLSDRGAIFYGAFWCPHCRDQKAMFGKSTKYLQYVECSTPDGKGMIQRCADEGIGGFPTWRFAEGEEISGTASLETLASRTGCELPE